MLNSVCNTRWFIYILGVSQLLRHAFSGGRPGNVYGQNLASNIMSMPVQRAPGTVCQLPARASCSAGDEDIHASNFGVIRSSMSGQFPLLTERPGPEQRVPPFAAALPRCDRPPRRFRAGNSLVFGSSVDQYSPKNASFLLRCMRKCAPSCVVH